MFTRKIKLRIFNIFSAYHKSFIRKKVCQTKEITCAENSIKKSTIEHKKLLFFSNLFGTSSRNAYKCLRDYPNLVSLPIADIEETFQTLKNLGISKDDIFKNFIILQLNKNVIKHRHSSLKEIGLVLVGAPELIHFKNFMNSSIATLRKINIISCEEDQFRNVLQQLNCDPDLENQIRANFSLHDNVTVYELRKHIMTNCLSYYLNVPTAHSIEIYEQVKDLSSSSIIHLKQTIEFVKQKLNIDLEIFKSDPGLLNAFPSDLEELLKICDKFELSFRQLVQKYPKVLLCQPDYFLQICNSLIDFDIPKENLLKHPKIFSIPPTRIENGVKTLKTWPEMQMMKYDSTFMKLLTNYKRVNMHMLYLKLAGFEQFSTADLTSTDETFRKVLSHHEEKSSRNVIMNYLAKKLGVSKEEILSIAKNHPLFLKASMLTVRNNLTLLLNEGFNRNQILIGLPVLFFSTDQLAKRLNYLPFLPLTQPYESFRDKENILQFLLYNLEKIDSNLSEENLTKQ